MRSIRDVTRGHSSDDEMYEAITGLAREVRQIQPRRFCAPDAAAAWAYLLGLDLVGTTANDPRARPRPVYRGQRKTFWGLSASLNRLHGNVRSLAIQQSNHFAQIVSKEFHKLSTMDSLVDWPPVHSESGRATAQHFRMETTLLDWSSNYSVALDFATRRADGQTAAIWWFNVSDDLMPDLRIILPPPFVHRLYLQRGVFVDVPDEDAESNIERISCKIEFPATHHEPAGVFADGAWHILPTLEPPNRWFETLRSYCRSETGRAARARSISAINRYLAFESYKRHLQSPPLSPTEYIVCDSWGLSTSLGQDGLLEYIATHILSLAGRMDVNGDVWLDGQLMKLLERENKELVDWASPWFDHLIRRNQSLWPTMRQALD